MGKNHFSKASEKGKLYNALFAVLFVLFLIAGIFSAGSFRSTGKAYYNSSSKNTAAVFNLTATSDQKLKSVYVNVGSVYAPVGEDVTLTVKRYSSTTSSTSYTFGSEQTVGNVYSLSGQGQDGKLFNWIEVTDETARVVKAVSIQTDHNVEINEIVCLDEDGNRLPLSVNTTITKGYTNAKTTLAAAFDAQESFTKELSARRNFTEEEAYTLCAVRNVLQDSTFNEGDAYIADQNFNALGTLVYVPFIALFGTSVGALRLPALLASAAAVFFLWAFAKLLFKDEKCALIAAALFAFGGLALSVGLSGTPYAIVLSALCGSLYFAYRFFARGVSSAHVIRGATNVLFSGLFAAVAIAIDLFAILPVIGILVLLFFGMRRMKRAHENEMNELNELSAAAKDAAEIAEVTASAESTETDPSEAKDTKEKALLKKVKFAEVQYAYKKRVTAAFAVLSFCVVTFLLILLSCVLSYSAYVKAFDAPEAPTLGFGAMLWKGVSSAWTKGNVTSFTKENGAIAFAWFLPLKPATLYAAGLANGAGGAYFAKHAFINPVLTVAALAAFVYVSVRFVLLLVRGEKDKAAMRTVRGYLVLVGGMLLTLLYGLVGKYTSAATAYLFYPLYLALIPFAYKTWKDGKANGTNGTEVGASDEAASEKKGNKAADVVLYVVLGLAFVCFCTSIPAVVGFGVSEKVANILFGWMNIINNGFFRI